MICDDCNKSDVCKHYDYLKEYNGLKLKECSYKTYNYNINNNINTNNIYKRIDKPITTTYTNQTNSNNLDTNTLFRENISNKIQEINNSKLTDKEKNKDFKIVKTPTELVECPSCGEKVYEDDLSVCDKCNKTICSACGTQSFDCNEETLKNVCDTCWNNKKDEIKDDVLKWGEFLGKNIRSNNTLE